MLSCFLPLKFPTMDCMNVYLEAISNYSLCNFCYQLNSVVLPFYC